MENNLKGVIPNEMNYFEDLMKLELYYNELYGAIPDLYRLINLYNFDVDGNALEGAVPASLFNLPNIGKILKQKHVAPITISVTNMYMLSPKANL